MAAQVVVVGGGITGLAAAWAADRAGHPVVVIDADERLGGKLRTSSFAGRPVDEGADAFLLRVPWALDLARSVGLGDDLVHPAERRAHVFVDGALRPLPSQLMGVPVDLDAAERSGLLSADGARRARLDLTEPAGALTGPDVAVADEIERRLGAEVVDRLVDPLVGGINAGDTRAMSLAAVVPQLDAAARDTGHPSLVAACRAQLAAARAAGTDPAAPIFAAPRGGMARLVEAVVAALPDVHVVTGRRVVALEPTRGNDWAVNLDDRTRHEGRVVLAVPAPVAGSLLARAGAVRAADLLSDIRHTSVAFATLAVRPEDLPGPLEGSGVLVPRSAGTALTACSWASSKWAHLAPEHGDGTVLLRAAAGRTGDQAALDLDDADLVARLVDDLGRVMGLTAAPVASRVTRWVDGFPQYAPGHLERIASAEADIAQRAPGVAVAGMALRGVGIPACIRSGLDAVATACRPE